MRRLTWPRAATALSACIGLAVLQSWPLPRQFATHLTGSPAGDTGVYIWNQWVFAHELLAQRSWPLFTSTIFAGDAPANLAHHNFTLAADLMALPLLPWLGTVATFNLIWLTNVALAAFGMYLLARRVTGREAESLIAGGVFACSGFMVGRATAHLSLTSAAPLPFFVLALLNCWDDQRPRNAGLLGLTMAWAFLSEPYYAVYCVMLAAGFLAARALHLALVPTRRPAIARALTAAILLCGGVIAARLLLGGRQWALGSWYVSIRSLYTPVLILTTLLVIRTALSVKIWACWSAWPSRWTALRLAIVAGVVSLIVAGPLLASHAAGEAMTSPTILWRTSPRGVDLLAFLLPHWNHPLLPDLARAWLATHSEGLVAQSASLSPAFFLLLALAAWRAGWRPPAHWRLAAVTFAAMALGPFVHIAGINTYVPTPWTLLRYLPLIGEARMPSRLAVVAALAGCVLLASALGALTGRWPHRRRAILSGTIVMFALALWPWPSVLHPANIPVIYDVVKTDTRDVSVLVLPTGVRDGLSSLGDFSALAQYHQTFHGRPLIGGYLSRTSPQRQQAHRDHPVLGVLIAAGDGTTPDMARWTSARNAAGAFIASTRLGYVVIDQQRSSPELTRAAIDILRLELVQSAEGYSLYVPTLK
jgi:hypothetical protein